MRDGKKSHILNRNFAPSQLRDIFIRKKCTNFFMFEIKNIFKQKQTEKYKCSRYNLAEQLQKRNNRLK